MPLQDLLLLVFCLVDDQLKALRLERPRQRGPDPELADGEVITIELVGEYLGLDRDSRLFWHFRQHHRREFPALARVHRTTFARQAANLWPVKRLLQRRLAERLSGAAADWLVDSMPLPVCRFGRGGFCKGFRGLAAFGYDSLQKQTYYGFRLHLRTSREGVILAYELAPANASDLAVLPELAPPPGTTGIGDRNYWSPQVAEDLAESGVRLLAPYQSKKYDPDPARSRRLSTPRWRVETVNSQLAGRYNSKRIRARDLWHLCHRLIRKILSHTVAVWLNVATGRPPLQLAALVAA
jgi:Transposase DDE domain